MTKLKVLIIITIVFTVGALLGHQLKHTIKDGKNAINLYNNALTQALDNVE